MITSLNRLVAWAGTCAAVAFLFGNIRTTDMPVGYHFLLIVLACAAGNVLLVESPGRSVVVRASVVPLIAFLAYFLLRMILDIHDPADMKAYTIGTTGGILFALIFGTATSVFLGVLGGRHDLPHRGLLGTTCFLGLCALLALYVLLTHLGSRRADLFLIEGTNLSYQRPGSLATIAALVVSTHLAIAVKASSAGVASRALLASCFAFYAFTIAALMLTAQLVGSNLGFVLTFLLGAGTFTWLWRPRLRQLQWRRLVGGGRLTLGAMLLRSSPRLALSGIALLAVAALAGLLILAKLGIDVHSFRIFGFSEGRVGGNSLSSRFALLTNDFVRQLAVAPFFGNLNADALTSGRGTYAHSLLSLLSHTGIVGASLFVSYAARLFRELRRPALQGAHFYSDVDFVLFRAVMMGVILFFACIGTFFTWMPLWFACGLLLPSLLLKRASAYSPEACRATVAVAVDRGVL